MEYCKNQFYLEVFMKTVLFLLLSHSLSFSLAEDTKKMNRKPSSESGSIYCQGKSGADKFILEICYSRTRKKNQLVFNKACATDQQVNLTENDRQISKDIFKVVNLSFLLTNAESSLSSEIKQMSFQILKDKNEITANAYYSELTGWNVFKYESMSGSQVTKKLSTDFKCLSLPNG